MSGMNLPDAVPPIPGPRSGRVLNFPAHFLWGTATSPTQVEGHIHNEWTDFVAQDGGTCRIACDHYHRYPEDVEWMSRLGVKAYRMGIEWSRLQAEPYAALNRVELDRYRDLLDRLQTAGIVPMVVLHHFSNPPWISSAGGWVNPATIPAFVDFVAKLASALRGRIRLWNTFNEPDTYASFAYLLGEFPPFKKRSLRSFYRAITHMADAHVQASRVIRQQAGGGPPPEIGIAKNWACVRGHRPWAVWDHCVGAVVHAGFNHFVLRAFLGGRRRAASTFLGVNYYGRVQFENFSPLAPAGGAARDKLARRGILCDDMLERHPSGLESALLRLSRTSRLPIYLTEHGSASDDDAFRTRDLKQHLAALHGALRRGADVRGFFYWSLLDNFEWQFGYAKKFGLVAVDFHDPNLPRRMKTIGEEYRAICTANSVTLGSGN